MILDALAAPIVLAPLAGGPSTPGLAAAVSEAGGLGFLAAGYLTPDELAGRVGATRTLTGNPFGVNLFAPVSGPADPATYSAYVERLSRWAEARRLPVGQPRHSDDGYAAKLAQLEADPVRAVSFTFGCPERQIVERLRAAGSEVWVTVTSPQEADRATEAGADALVVQGSAAGGHRGSFKDDPDQPSYSLLPLLQLISARYPVPLIGSGGIMTGRAVAAVLCAGARAAQLGTAFMLCDEAGTDPTHRAALESARSTKLTRAFTGRTARGIRNAFMDEHDAHAPLAYPEIHYVTAPFRKVMREAGDETGINMWAGEAHELVRRGPARLIVEQVSADARDALADVAARLNEAENSST